MSCIDDAPYPIVSADLDHLLPGEQNTWIGDDRINHSDDLLSLHLRKRTKVFFEISNNLGVRRWKKYSKLGYCGVRRYIGDIFHGFAD